MKSVQYFQLIGFVGFLALQIQGKWQLVEVNGRSNNTKQRHHHKPIKSRSSRVNAKKGSIRSETNKANHNSTGQDYSTFSFTIDLGKKTVAEPTAGANCECGRPRQNRKTGNRIIGGDETFPYQYPWMVRIDDGCSGGTCTGSLISDRHILTAFHCMAPKHATGYGSEPCDHSKKDRIAYIGGHYISSRRNPWTGVRQNDAIYSVPLTKMAYPPNPKVELNVAESHDIAIYILETPVKFSKRVQPICLPKIGVGPREDDRVVAAGWGDYRIGKNHLNSNVLRDVEIKLGKNLAALPKFFTTKFEKNSKGVPKDPCSGDSGGPLMWKNNDEKMTVIGTVFGGGFNCDTNSFTSDQIWSNVTSHLNWIMRTIRSDEGTKICS